MYKEGKRPSEILRMIVLDNKNMTPPDLMQLCHEAFGLSYSAVQCIGGWWVDGSAELSDSQLDEFLLEEIDKLQVDTNYSNNLHD